MEDETKRKLVYAVIAVLAVIVIVFVLQWFGFISMPISLPF
ncbi:MAG: hypothetical protein ABH829_04065 [archaeon]